MVRILSVSAMLLAGTLTVPAVSQETAAPAGRFQIAPGEGSGFIRLDTKSGAVSHCGQRDGIWYCEALVDAALEDRLAALSTDVSRLSAGLDRLSARVDGLAARISPIDAAEPPDVGQTSEAPGLAEAVLRRFLDMVRELKRDGPDRI